MNTKVTPVILLSHIIEYVEKYQYITANNLIMIWQDLTHDSTSSTNYSMTFCNSLAYSASYSLKYA